MKTQNERLLDYLKKHGKITQFEAISELGILRLASRVNDCRNSGISILSSMVEVKNRFGENCRVAEYRLMKVVS